MQDACNKLWALPSSYCAFAVLQALLSSDVLRRLMRNTESLLQQLGDHHMVHEKIVATAAAAEGLTLNKQDSSSPQPAAAAGTPIKSPGKPGRRFVVPRVSLSRGLPAW